MSGHHNKSMVSAEGIEPSTNFTDESAPQIRRPVPNEPSISLFA